ncbi:MAG TPA: MYXO-CTERM sorting domain-containing protein [Labilithrix sp.]
MGWRTVIGLAGAATVSALVACQEPAEEDAAGDQAAVQQDPFDRNNVLDDKSLRDSAAMSAADVQKFLDVTPWGTKSALADYKEDGKTAAEIITDAAKKHNVNPIELLVRAQAEQGLIKKTTAKDTTIAIAFGCGCPDSAACSDAYRGLANQAECAAGTIDRSMSRASTTAGTVSGWAKAKEKASLDGLVITPANSATAAIYTYTPWVGEKGGGKVGVGGAYLHWDVWGSFAQYLNYGDWGQNDTQAQSGDGGAAANDAAPSDDASAPDPNPNPDPGSGDPDPGTDDAGPSGDGTPSAGPKDDGSDDGKVLNGNAPPAVNAPPPGSHPRTSAAPNLPQELPQASDADLAGKPKTTGGCSTSGGTGDASLVGLGLAIALVAARRRR